jgi:PrtD family type I secretion system ABC transporter
MALAPLNRGKNKEGRLKTLMRQCRIPYIWVGIFSFATNMLVLPLSIYSLQVLDRVMSSHSMMTLAMLTLITVVCFIFYGLFTATRGAVLAGIGNWMDRVLSPELMKTAVQVSAIGVPVSSSQYQRDLNNFKSFVAGQGITTLFDAPWSILFIFIIYLINPLLGIVTLIGAFLLLAFGAVTEFSTKKPIDQANELNIRNMQYAEATSRNAEAVEAMGMLGVLVDGWKRQTEQTVELANIAGSRSNILMAASRVLRMVLQIAVTGVGSWLAINGELTIGGMIGASILSGRALAPFEAAIGTWKQWITARDAYHRLENALSDTPAMRGTMEMPAPGGTLTVEQLIYRTPKTNQAIIKGISFSLKPGQSLGLIGPSAAGKSTLARLLMGILPPTNGSVRLDGVDIFQWSREDIGKYVGYLPQNVELFPGTIKDNIARMDPNASDAEVIEAARLAGCHEMVLRLPMAYETVYSAANLSLSPGQRQRIGLARALFRKPQFVVLDEPNSNLDGEGELALQETILRIKKLGITFILVAHKPSIVSHVDLIMMLQDGLIKDFGPRNDVLRKYVAPVSPAAQAAGQVAAQPAPAVPATA